MVLLEPVEEITPTSSDHKQDRVAELRECWCFVLFAFLCGCGICRSEIEFCVFISESCENKIN
jgi:hypothetical protein